MTAETHQAASKARKPYKNNFQSLMDIWMVLATYASAEHPMTAGEIHDKLEELYGKDAPSKNSVDRHLREDGGAKALDTLFPHTMVYCNGEPASELTISRQLQMMHSPAGTLPTEVVCVAAKNNGLRTTYVDYDDHAFELAKETAKKTGKSVSACMPKNLPRRYYLKGMLDPRQWRIFSDLVQVYPYINNEEAAEFLSALERLCPGCTKTGTRYTYKQPDGIDFDLVGKLDAAIKQHRQVVVTYREFHLLPHPQKSWEPVMEPRTKNSQLTVAPFALMWSNGYYYLVCREVKKGGMMNLRMDRISDVKEMTITFAPDPTFDPVAYRDRSPVMYPGPLENARFRCKLELLNTLVDFFGRQAQFSAPSNGETTVSLRVSLSGLKLFALQYADQVEVLEPQSLRDELCETLSAAAKKYE